MMINSSKNVADEATNTNTEAAIDLLFLIQSSCSKDSKKLAIYTQYIEKIKSHRAYPLLTVQHLSETIGVDITNLNKFIYASENFYKLFKIKKKSGPGFRDISAPNRDLFYIQKWIAKHLLTPYYENPERYVTGYTKKRSILDHVRPHLTSKNLIKIDIKDFFPSITESDVFVIFNKIGYTNSLCNALARILTLNGHLPQGSPASPILSNIHMTNFDKKTANYCLQRNLNYSRYADDIVISGNNIDNTFHEICTYINEYNLAINVDKIKISKDKSGPRIITGLSICNETPRLPKAMRRKIRHHTHKLISSLKSINDKDDQELLTKKTTIDPLLPEKILGQLRYWKQIEPINSFAIQSIEKINYELNRLKA